MSQLADQNPPLPVAERLRLSQNLACAASRDRLVLSQTRFLLRMAGKMYGRRNSMEIEDLVQEGFVGLLQASKPGRFDPERGIAFLSYGAVCAHDQILRSIDLGALVRDRRLWKRRHVRMNPPVGEIDEEMQRKMSADAERQPETLVQHRELAAVLRGAVDRLGERDATIIRLRYLTDPQLTLQEVGQRIALSRERVRQIEAEALDQLRRVLRRLAPEQPAAREG